GPRTFPPDLAQRGNARGGAARPPAPCGNGARAFAIEAEQADMLRSQCPTCANALLHSERRGKSVTSTSDTEVVIIGGGAAGIAAARRIVDAQLGCLLLEARSRRGGRARVWPPR